MQSCAVHAYLHVHGVVQMSQASAQALRWPFVRGPWRFAVMSLLTRFVVGVEIRFNGLGRQIT